MCGKRQFKIVTLILKYESIKQTSIIAKPCSEAFIVIYENKIENREEGEIYKVIKQ